jgi:hypothetical protein
MRACCGMWENKLVSSKLPDVVVTSNGSRVRELKSVGERK